MAGRDSENNKARPIFIRSFAALGWKVHPNKNWYAFTQGISNRVVGILMGTKMNPFQRGKLIGTIRAALGQQAAGSADEKESGKSDLFVDAGGKFIYVEIKWFEGTIVLSDWRENQREWLSKHGNVDNYYIAVMVEPTHNARNTRVNKAGFFLVPARKWIDAHTITKSIPLTAELGRGEIIAETHWEAYRLTSPATLSLKHGELGIPNSHQIFTN